MRAERLRPRGRGAVFQPIPPTYHRAQHGRFACSLARLSRFEQRVGDDSTTGGSKAVVVKTEDLEGPVLGEEGDDGVY